MKKILIALIMACFSLPAFSQFASDVFSNDYETEGWLKKGYRGFVETGGGSNHSFFINTTHGYQFSEWFFVGGGLGYLTCETYVWDGYYYGSYPSNALEYFADLRLTVPTNSRFYPFADLKLGGVWGGYYGDTSVYVSTNIGVRFALNNNLGLSLGIYYNYANDDFSDDPIVGGAVGFDF